MTKKELEEKIEKLEIELALLKLEHFSKEKHSIWKPENKEQYFYISEHGVVLGDRFQGFNYQKSMIDFGNYFKSQEEAEKQANYQKYANLLRKYVEEHSERGNWDNESYKFGLFYDYELNGVYILPNKQVQYQGSIYSPSEEVLRNAIEFVGEENVKKYIFGVED